MDIKVQAGNILETDSDLAVLATFEDVPLPVQVAALTASCATVPV